MKRHTSPGNQRQLVRERVGDAPPTTTRRRWLCLITAATCIAAAMAGAIAFLTPPSGERAILRESIAELVSGSSPDAAVVLREAEQVADRLLKRFPENGDALDVVASLYHGLGKTKDAVRCWQRSMELDPALGPIAQAAIGGAAYDDGDFGLAAECFRRALEEDPKSSVYPVRLAEAMIEQGRHQEALAVLLEDIKFHPRSMPARVLIGRTYLKLRDYEKARQHLELAVELGPTFTNAYHGLITAYARLGDQEKAREYTKKFKQLNALEEERHRRALKTAGTTVEVRAVLARTYIAASRIYIRHGDYQTAEDSLRRATALAPGQTECDIALAWLYEQQGRTAKALATLAELSRMASDDLGAQMSIAAAYGRLGELEQAERAYRRVIELSPGRGSGYAALADFYLRVARQPAQAAAAAQKAVELEPLVEYCMLLYLSREAGGDLAGAAAALDQALALDPGNRHYQELSFRLRNKLKRQTVGK